MKNPIQFGKRPTLRRTTLFMLCLRSYVKAEAAIMAHLCVEQDVTNEMRQIRDTRYLELYEQVEKLLEG